MFRFRLCSLVLLSTVILSGASVTNAEDLKVGQKAPGFSAGGIDGKEWKLSGLSGKKGKNVVLLFARASW